jgi:hypothetical protein
MTTPERGIRPEPDAVLHEAGSLREMTDRLRSLAVGWEHLDKPKNAQDCTRAAEALESGAFSVRVGVTTYTVTSR